MNESNAKSPVSEITSYENSPATPNRSTRVLMVTNALDLGGAETHLVELTRGLTMLGYSVSVASNGGQYVADLSAMGVSHHQLPLHQRSIRALLVSLFGLIRLVRKERPHLIHAHARIPAFLSRLTARLTGVPVVTTVHWPFDTAGWQRFFTWWSPYSIAVSDDLREYLVQQFAFKPEQVAVIPNGINTNDYKSSPPDPTIYREFGWEITDTLVIYVSRLTGNIAAPAFALLNAVLTLGQEMPALRVLVVGDGDRRAELQTLAAEANQKIGRSVVTVAGRRSDLTRLLPTADVFVGVSRAALEAMSCERPVILAGSQGYLGIFTAAGLEAAIRTNFTGRDHEAVSPEALVNDLRTLLNDYSEEERQQLGIIGRQAVEDYYSSQTMVRLTHEFYQKILTQKVSR